MWKYYNPNPAGRHVGDCAIRAISKALGIDWEEAHDLLSYNSKMMSDMPSANSVWGATLREHGFRRRAIPNYCPDCYTAEDFARDHPHGVFVLGFGNHTATIKDGILFDSWNSSAEIPQYYWYRKE